jgi:heme oxygenase
MKSKQKELFDELYNILLKINKEGLNDDEFYKFLNENYPFQEDLEEIIFKTKKMKETYKK